MKNKKKFGNNLDWVDKKLDRKLDDVSMAAVRSRAKAKDYGKKAAEKTGRAVTIGDATRKRIDETGDRITNQLRNAEPGETIRLLIVERPLFLIVTLIVVCSIIMAAGIPRMLGRVDGNMEVYLPENDPAADVVHEVRVEGGSWSVDVLIIYVEAPNSWDPYDKTNVTNVNVLAEMDRIERTLNPERGDEGAIDGVRFVLSLSVVVQEVNNTPSNFEEAFNEMYPGAGAYLGTVMDLEGEYAIPDQATVDSIVDYIPPEFKEMLVTDTNGDGIYDTTAIYIGLDKDVDQAEFYDFVVETLNQPLNYTRMGPTGPVAMTRSLTVRTYQETIKIVPLALLLVFASLLFFHRTPKVIIICGIPIGLSVGTTFGFLGLLNVVITPQVLLIAPVLIALGVAYGIYIANRYAEEKGIADPRERILYAIEKTHRPIFLSAMTTSIGFASLMTANMMPVKVIGFALSMGILFSYCITMLIVPSLILFTKYEKQTSTVAWRTIGEIPVDHRKKILVVAVLVLFLSVSLLPRLEANLDVFEMAPSDDDTINKMAEFAEKFGGGQIGMAIIYGNPRTNVSWDRSMEDPNVLSDIDILQIQARKVENTKCITVVDLMKTVRVPQDIILNGSRLPDIFPIPFPIPDDFVLVEANTSFWDVITTNPIVTRNPGLQQDFIRLFYGSISTEIRFLLVNKDYSKTLMLVDMPTMDAVNTKKTVTEMDYVLADHGTNIKGTSPLTGAAAIAVAVNDLLLASSFQTLFIALALVLVLLTLAFRSLKYAAITLVPVALVTAYQPLSFWIFGLELNLLTGMVGSMIVGIGIDFGIHMTDRIRERGETVKNISYAVETSGSSFFEATATVLLGISSAFIAGIPSVNQFVLLISFLFVLCMIGAIFILPAIYAVKILEK